jgi:hypothetical protein
MPSSLCATMAAAATVSRFRPGSSRRLVQPPGWFAIGGVRDSYLASLPLAGSIST